MKYLLFILLILGITCSTPNEDLVWSYLKEYGLTDAGAAGLMGNLQVESNMKSVIYENSWKSSLGLTDQEYVDKVNDGSYTNFVNDQVGFGLAQWTWYTRKQALLDACKGDIGNLKCQLKYLMYEFETDYKDILLVLKSSTDVTACTLKVMIEFENPVDQSELRKKIRIDLAKQYYNIYTGSGPVGKTYTVVEGDSLWEIAQRFGTTIDELCRLNNITNGGMIYVGQILFLPD